MAQDDLDNFGAYRKANELFDLVVEEMRRLEEIPMSWRLVSQQVASADSIAANIEEG